MAAHDAPNGGTGARVAAAAAPPAPEAPRDRPIGDLVKDLAGQTSTLIRQEIELAQAELSQKGKQAGKGAGMLAGAGVAIPDEWIGHGAHGRYEARDLAHRMLAGRRRPTAIFTASDTQAMGVIAAAREIGLHVPDDLSVIGYDDIEVADYVGLTTIRQQLFESGRRGAEVLLSEIGLRSEEPPVIPLTPELVVRATTAPPKEGRG